MYMKEENIMSQELEALNKLFVLSSEYHHKLWCLKLAPVSIQKQEKYIDRIVECLSNDGGELNDLYNYIKQALKRNESMKVAYEKNGVSYCPNCYLSYLRNAMSNENHYCGNCGQKLDWSDEK